MLSPPSQAYKPSLKVSSPNLAKPPPPPSKLPEQKINQQFTITNRYINSPHHNIGRNPRKGRSITREISNLSSSKSVRSSVDIPNPHVSVDVVNIDVQGTIASHIPSYNGILDFWNKTYYKDKMDIDAPKCIDLPIYLERKNVGFSLFIVSAHSSKRKWVDEYFSSHKTKKQKIVEPLEIDFHGKTQRVQNKRGRDPYVDIIEFDYEDSSLIKRLKVNTMKPPKIEEELEMPFTNCPSPLQSTSLSISNYKASLRNGLDSLIVVDDVKSLRRSTFASLETGKDCNDAGYTSFSTSHFIVSPKVITILLNAWVRWLIAWFFLLGINDEDCTHLFSLLGVEEYSDFSIQQLRDAENIGAQVFHSERDFQNRTNWDWKINFGMFSILGPTKLRFLQVELELKKTLRRKTYRCIDSDKKLADIKDGERKRKPRVAYICFMIVSKSRKSKKVYCPDIRTEQLQVSRLLELIHNIPGLEWLLAFVEMAVVRGIPFDPGLEWNSKKDVQVRDITWTQRTWRVFLLIYSFKLKVALQQHRFSTFDLKEKQSSNWRQNTILDGRMISRIIYNTYKRANTLRCFFHILSRLFYPFPFIYYY